MRDLDDARSARAGFTLGLRLASGRRQLREPEWDPAPASFLRRLLGRRGLDPLLQTGEALVDLERHRCWVTFGARSLVVVGDREWSGRPGKKLADVPATPAGFLQPLWLLDAVHAATGAELAGAPDGQLRARLDLSGPAGRALAMPPGLMDADALRAVELDAWLDDGRLRRLRYRDANADVSLDLLEVGVSVPDSDPVALPD